MPRTRTLWYYVLHKDGALGILICEDGKEEEVDPLYHEQPNKLIDFDWFAGDGKVSYPINAFFHPELTDHRSDPGSGFTITKDGDNQVLNNTIEKARKRGCNGAHNARRS